MNIFKPTEIINASINLRCIYIYISDMNIYYHLIFFPVRVKLILSKICNKRPMGPVSLTRFRLQNYLKVFAISGTLF